MKDRIFVIDGSSYLYRAYHAMPPLSTSTGRPTGAVKGVTNMLMNLKKDSEGSPIIVVFDAKGKTFRNEIYPEYKANRPPMPDELRLQLEPVKAICKAIGFPLIVFFNASTIPKYSICVLNGIPHPDRFERPSTDIF